MSSTPFLLSLCPLLHLPLPALSSSHPLVLLHLPLPALSSSHPLVLLQGDQYWRLDDGVVEPGYPQPLSSGFSGLTGSITAALPVPATRRRPEAVYFFKKGEGGAHDHMEVT